MKDHKAASRYAKSLLDLAIEQQVLEPVYADFSFLNNLLGVQKELVKVLNSPVVPGHKKFDVLMALFKGKNHKLTMSFFQLLTQKHRESELASIAKSFVLMYQTRMGFSNAEVTTAVKLTPALQASFSETVEKITGKKVLLKEKTDPKIIGGFILKMGDLQIDESIDSKIKKLKNTLVDTSYIAKIPV